MARAARRLFPSAVIQQKIAEPLRATLRTGVARAQQTRIQTGDLEKFYERVYPKKAKGKRGMRKAESMRKGKSIQTRNPSFHPPLAFAALRLALLRPTSGNQADDG